MAIWETKAYGLDSGEHIYDWTLDDGTVVAFIDEDGAFNGDVIGDQEGDISGNVNVPTGDTATVVDADALTVGGVIVPQAIAVVFNSLLPAAMVDQSFFTANAAYQVVGVNFVGAVAEATAVSLLVQVTKDTGTDAPGAGTNLLTNNTNTGFNTKSTANTVQVGTLSATVADLQLASGNRLSVDFSAAATELAGVTITVYLKRI